MKPHQGLRPFVFVVLALAAVAGLAARPSSQSRNAGLVVLSGAEFPDYDAEVLSEERNGLVNKSLSVRLKQKPGVPEAADLLQQNRVDEALRVLHSIIRDVPEDIPRAFEVVVEQSSRFSDVARGYPDSLQELVTAARKQLPRLSQEERARAERQLLLIDRSVPADQRRSSPNAITSTSVRSAVSVPSYCCTKARSRSAVSGRNISHRTGPCPITGPLTVESTRGCQHWTDIVTTVTLPAGTHLLDVVLDTPGSSGAIGNLNYLTFVRIGQPGGVGGDIRDSDEVERGMSGSVSHPLRISTQHSRL